MLRVLLVEDDPANRLVIEDIFEFDGVPMKLMVVENGEEAIEYVQTSSPHLILMDISLPGINGLKVTSHLKQQSKTRSIPVWALTAHAMVSDAKRCFEAGCSRYLTKPLNKHKLTLLLLDFAKQHAYKEHLSCTKY